MLNCRLLQTKPSSKEDAKLNHRDAERTRRSRICGHYATLRCILPNLIKKNKASVLKETINCVKHLEITVSELIAESRHESLESVLPSGEDRLAVEHREGQETEGLVKVMFCCEDRRGVMSDITKIVKSTEGKVVKAEMVAVGGRIKCALWVQGVNGNEELGILRLALHNTLIDRPNKPMTRNRSRHILL